MRAPGRTLGRRAVATRALLLAAILAVAGGVARAETSLKVEIVGPATVDYDPAKDSCKPNDLPDMNARAFRDAAGAVTLFALHLEARPLVGPDFDHLKIRCESALDSPLDPDPAHFADRLYLASLWTRNGRDIGALVHEEYHADEHARCAVSGGLACWYNTILGYRSADGARRFVPSRPLVVAAAPFTQDFGQGRHRGFFEPSNMFGDGRFVYAFATTTGWDGQSAGACLFRTGDPMRSEGWRTYDGRGFTIRYADPYTSHRLPEPCTVIQPFGFAVNSVVRHTPSGLWLAVLQAPAAQAFPVSGFYYATSRDLVHWDGPKLLLATRTLYDDVCKIEGPILNYPSVIDPASPSRNFDTIGETAMLYFVAMDAKACGTSHRLLLRRALRIAVAPEATP